MDEDLRERYDTLPGIGAIDQLYGIRDDATAIDTDGHPELEPLRTLLLGLVTYAESALSTIDPMLITDSVLSGLGTTLAALKTHMTAHLPAAPEHVETHVAALADNVRLLVAVAGTAPAPALLDVQLRLEAAATDAQQTLDELRASRGELAHEVEELNNRASELLETKSGALDSLMESGKVNITQVAEDGRRAYEEDRTELVKFGEDAVTAAGASLDELRRVLAIAGDESLSANYGKRADIEDEEARTLRTRAVGFGIATAVAAVLGGAVQAAAAIADWEYNAWASLPAKVALVSALAAIAAYYGRQAAGHRNYGQQLRNAQLELHNIGPYLAELDSDARGAVRRELVPTFFGKAIPSVKEDAPTTAASAEQIIEIARLLLAKQ